jgi:hypothetical protein
MDKNLGMGILSSATAEKIMSLQEEITIQNSLKTPLNLQKDRVPHSTWEHHDAEILIVELLYKRIEN